MTWNGRKRNPYTDPTTDKNIENLEVHEEILHSVGHLTSLSEAKEFMRHRMNVHNRPTPNYLAGFEFSYMFITRPELNLYQEGDHKTLSDPLGGSTSWFGKSTDEDFSESGSSDLSMLVKRNRELCRFLDSNVKTSKGKKSPFMFPLMNLLKEANMQDVEFSTKPSPSNRLDISIEYPMDYMESLAGIPLELTFNMDRYDTVLNMINIWTMYMTEIKKGNIRPKLKHQLLNMFESSCAIYQFVTAEDGQTIKFWAKWTGCYPQSIPYSEKSHAKRKNLAGTDVSVSFYAPFFKPMRPSVIHEFNELVRFDPNDFHAGDWESSAVDDLSADPIDNHFAEKVGIVTTEDNYKIQFFTEDE